MEKGRRNRESPRVPAGRASRLREQQLLEAERAKKEAMKGKLKIQLKLPIKKIVNIFEAVSPTDQP